MWFELEKSLDLQPNERIVEVSNGLIIVENASKTRSMFVHEASVTSTTAATSVEEPLIQ